MTFVLSNWFCAIIVIEAPTKNSQCSTFIGLQLYAIGHWGTNVDLSTIIEYKEIE